MRERGKQIKVRSVEVVAEYKPDEKRMLEALMLVLALDDESLSPEDLEHADAIRIDSVS